MVRVSVSQFARHIHTKKELMYALGVKGKNRSFRLIFLHFGHRSDIFAYQAVLHTPLHSLVALRAENLLSQQSGDKGDSSKVQGAVGQGRSKAFHVK